MTLEVQNIGDWMRLTHTSLDVGGLGRNLRGSLGSACWSATPCN
jgi:hypothetical protein